ncbi:armadillo-type protein [Cokeromyces recurvatus]|uniref:armadillo-type protein n=1 Tax=Cokeromyces recurvatus TaxID=90255 RepID=UPI00221EFC24|nr:armadillo-type protein [Cokeromyces recurvatus]KAI7899319.1 armadillo-type protein [Cokeromyces recurvatus]
MSAWQPSAQGLTDLLQLLREAINPTDGHNVQERLEYFNKIPDYNNYLVYILTQMPQEDQYIRSVAGLTLKNNIRSYFPTISPEVVEYIKDCCLRNIGDASVGKPVSMVIASIVSRGGIQQWPQVLQVLLEKLDDPNPVMVENAFSTFQKICEDSSRDLDTGIGGVKPLEFMIPKFIAFFDHPDYKIRLSAISCVSQFIMLRSTPLMTRINEFLNALFKRATDDNIDVRKAVCQSLVSLLEICPEVLLPHLPDLVEYMLFCTQSDDSDLALEACEFWLVFAEQDDLREHLHPYLQKIVPVLLKGMVYSEIDLMTLGGDEDDAHIADSEQDIKPRFHKANVVETDGTNKDDEANNAEKRKTGLLGDEDSDLDDEDEDEDDYDDFEDDEFYGEWNLRKCSAATLDVLCTSFEADVIRILIPLLKGELESEDWLHRECGILALGAAAEGGMQEIAPHLPDLVPYLLNHLNDPKPLVRSITCWTLGRYCSWIVESARQTPDARQHYFEPLIQILLQRILDNNKRVQEAACSSFSLLEEEAGVDLVPYLQPILTTLCSAFTKYQKRNLLLLYDTIGTLADVVGEALNNPQYIDALMPPLINKWQEIADDSTDLFPLLECLSSVTTALGQGFKPFAEPVYNRCVVLVCKTLEECRLCSMDPSLEEPDKDFMIVALDLLSGIVQALNKDAEPLVANTNPPIVQLLSLCIQDEVAEVRQSTYALLGDLAISCFEHIRAVVPQFMPLLLQQIDPVAEHVSVCNNATWAAGEIALKWGAEIRPYVDPLLQRLFPLMMNTQTQRTLLENVAITIGRLGLVCPNLVAPHLEGFIQPWLMALTPIRDNEEKYSAFSGLCEMIKVNPQAAVKEFYSFCSAVVNYQNVPQDLHESFANILNGYKNMFGETQWQQGLSSMPQEVRIPLQERYGI